PRSAIMYSRTPLGWRTWTLHDLDEHAGLRLGVWWKDVETSVIQWRPHTVLHSYLGSQYLKAPSPLSTAFWLTYREPVDDFLHAAKSLSGAIQDVSKLSTQAKGFDGLNALSEGAQQVIGRVK